MNTLTRLLAFSFMVVALPSLAADMNFEPKENITFKGKIATVKLLRNLELRVLQTLCDHETHAQHLL